MSEQESPQDPGWFHFLVSSLSDIFPRRIGSLLLAFSVPLVQIIPFQNLVTVGQETFLYSAVNNPLFIAFSLHTIVLAIFIITIPQPEPANIIADDSRAATALNQFRVTLLFLCLLWFLQYAALLFIEALSMTPANEPIVNKETQVWLSGFVNLFNNATAVQFFALYLILISNTAGPGVIYQFSEKQILLYVPILFWSSIDISFSAFFPESYSGSGDNFPWYLFFGLVSGLLVGLSFSLVIGRLDTKIIGFPRWLIVLLFTYGLIQMTWPILSERSDFAQAAPFVFGIALFFKILFFRAIRASMIDKSLAFYMIYINNLDRTIKQDRERFRIEHRVYIDEIRSGQAEEENFQE